MSGQTSTIPMPSSSSSSPSSPPEITSVNRLLSIPMVKALTTTLDTNLNAYLTTPYGAAKGLSHSIIEYTQPVQVRLSPIILKADSLANSSLDVVQAQLPIVFNTKPEDISDYLRGKKVGTEAYVSNVGKVIDQRCTPVVDVFESVVKKTGQGKTTTPIDSQYQYQRALTLSKDLSANLRELSTEQWNQLQNQSTLVQTATKNIQSFTASSYDKSTEILTELDHLRSATASFAAQFPQRTSTQLQSVYTEFSAVYGQFNTVLNSVISDLGNVAKEDSSVSEKASKMASVVQEKAKPLLDAMGKSLPTWSKPSEQNGDGSVH